MFRVPKEAQCFARCSRLKPRRELDFCEEFNSDDNYISEEESGTDAGNQFIFVVDESTWNPVLRRVKEKLYSDAGTM